MIKFIFNRQLHLDHFAKVDEKKETDKSPFYKKQSEGYKSRITYLEKLIKLGNGK